MKAPRRPKDWPRAVWFAFDQTERRVLAHAYSRTPHVPSLWKPKKKPRRVSTGAK